MHLAVVERTDGVGYSIIRYYDTQTPQQSMKEAD